MTLSAYFAMGFCCRSKLVSGARVDSVVIEPAVFAFFSRLFFYPLVFWVHDDFFALVSELLSCPFFLSGCHHRQSRLLYLSSFSSA